MDNFDSNLAFNESFSRMRRGRSVRIKTKGAPGSKGGEKILIEHYQLGEKIGKGAFSSVYQGLDIATGSFVAIKRVPRRKGFDETQLMNEMAILKTLKHDNIVKYIDLIVTDNNVNIILEYVESGSLAQVIEKFGVFPENLVAIYIEQVLKGLNYLHQNGIVHRDIKGPNLLITKDGVVKLADFGIAMATKVKDYERIRNLDSHSDSNSESDHPLSSEGESTPSNKTDSLGLPLGVEAEEWTIVEGSPFWMAPEIIQMNRPTPACDIWSLGCTVIELLTGSPPYFELPPLAALYKVVKEDHPPLPDFISPECESFLKSCFQKDPTKRPTAAALLQHPWIQKNIPKEERERYAEERRLERHIKRVSQHNMELEVLNSENWLRTMAEKFGYDLSELQALDTTPNTTNTITTTTTTSSADNSQETGRTTHSESAPNPLHQFSQRSNSAREKHKSENSKHAVPTTITPTPTTPTPTTTTPTTPTPTTPSTATPSTTSSASTTTLPPLPTVVHTKSTTSNAKSSQHPHHTKEPSEPTKRNRKLSQDRESHRSLTMFKGGDNSAPSSSTPPSPLPSPSPSPLPPPSSAPSVAASHVLKKHEKRSSMRDPKQSQSVSTLNYEGLMVVVVDHEIRKNFMFRYVVYILKIYTKEKSWLITRSFNEIKEMHEKLGKLYKDKLPPLPPPPKSWGGFETNYLVQKRTELQRYFEALLRVVDGATSKELLQFISQTKHDIKQSENKL